MMNIVLCFLVWNECCCVVVFCLLIYGYCFVVVVLYVVL